MANYFSQYKGGGPAALPPGYMEAATAPGRYLAEGFASVGENIAAGLEKHRQNKETRDILEETAFNEYARQLPAEGAEATPMQSEYLSQYGEKVRDASDLSIGELKGLVSSMQTDRNEMQKQRDHELQEKIYDLKERDTARLETATIADIGHKKGTLALEQEKQVSYIAYKGGMLDVERTKANLLEDKAYWDRFDALKKEEQAGKSKAENQKALRELFKNDKTAIGVEIQGALEGDFDPETIRPWIDTKIKAMADAAVSELESYKKPIVHDLGGGNKMVTFGKSSHMMNTVDGKLQMSADKMEQLRTRANETVAELMASFPYAAELDRKKKDENATTPIQDQIDGLKDYDKYLMDTYGPNAQTQSPTTPAAKGKQIKVVSPDGVEGMIPESQKNAALKEGFKIVE